MPRCPRAKQVRRRRRFSRTSKIRKPQLVRPPRVAQANGHRAQWHVKAELPLPRTARSVSRACVSSRTLALPSVGRGPPSPLSFSPSAASSRLARACARAEGEEQTRVAERLLQTNRHRPRRSTIRRDPSYKPSPSAKVDSPSRHGIDPQTNLPASCRRQSLVARCRRLQRPVLVLQPHSMTVEPRSYTCEMQGISVRRAAPFPQFVLGCPFPCEHLSSLWNNKVRRSLCRLRVARKLGL